MILLKRCCCFSLKTGAVIISLIGLIGAILGIVYLCIVRVFIEDISSYIIKTKPGGLFYATNNGSSIILMETADNKLVNHEIEDLRQFVKDIYSTRIFFIALLREILGGIFSALLVRGAIKEKRKLLLPWIIFTAFSVVGTAIWIIVCVVLLPISYGVAFCTVGLWESLVMIYFWIVILSFYLELKELENIERSALDAAGSQIEMKPMTYLTL